MSESDELMTWMPGQTARWRKMKDGKIYYVSCKQLGCQPSREESRESANVWWKIKEHEINELTYKTRSQFLTEKLSLLEEQNKSNPLSDDPIFDDFRKLAEIDYILNQDQDYAAAIKCGQF